MWMEEGRKITVSKGDLRKFGMTAGLILVLFSLVPREHRDGGQIAWWVGIASILAALLFPAVLRPFQKALAVAGFASVWIITRVVLILVFYLVVTPIGLTLRFSGRRPLDLGFSNNESRKSFWKYRTGQESAPSQLERQF